MNLTTQKQIQEQGTLPLKKEHICFDKGHAMFSVYLLHNHQSSYGQNKCSRYGFQEDWQYDYNCGNPMHTR